MPTGGTSLAVVWPPAGLLLGALAVSDRRAWKGLLAAAGVAALLSAAVHGRQVTAVPLVLVGLGEATAAAWFVRRTVDGPVALNRVSHAGTLILFAVVAPVFGGALAAAIMASAGGTPFLVAWRTWGFADALGMLATAPIAIAIFAERTRIRERLASWNTVEFVIVFAATVAVTLSIFGEALDPVIRVPAYTLPFLLWPAFRFGPGATSVTILTVSVIAIWHAARGLGPLALPDAAVTNLVLRSQGAMAVAATSLLLLASVVAERKRVAQENTVLVAELQRALLEVKTLRGFIPICAWCHKVRDDAGFWQQIEMYLDARTDATFSHSICPSCATDAGDEITAELMPPPPQ